MQITWKANRCFGCYINEYFLIADCHKFYFIFSLFSKPHSECISVNPFHSDPLWSRLPKCSYCCLTGSPSIPRASVLKTGKFDQFSPPEFKSVHLTEVFCINYMCCSFGRFAPTSFNQSPSPHYCRYYIPFNTFLPVIKLEKFRLKAFYNLQYFSVDETFIAFSSQLTE